MSRSFLEAIASYGQKYRKEHLFNRFEPDGLVADSWQALDFFLSRVCFQGRRDDLSQRVYETVIEVLKPSFSVPQRVADYYERQQQARKSLRERLSEHIGKGRVGNGKARDVEMVLSALEFIGELPDYNIVKHSLEQIRQGNLCKHCDELQGITQVGPKVAAVYLRDVVSLYELDDEISPDDAYCIQPVDTWVRKLAECLKIVDEGASGQAIQEAIAKLCDSEGISPILFNQGMWYVGYHAYDIALELLGIEGWQSGDAPPSARGDAR